jgi:hypothetical protein
LPAGKAGAFQRPGFVHIAEKMNIGSVEPVAERGKRKRR